MTAYVIRRLMLVPLILFGVTVLIFAVLQFLSPVERSSLYVRDVPRNERQLEAIIKRYGLDEPLHIQYWRWLTGTTNPSTGEREGGIIFGSLGYSRTASQPVADLIKTRFPATVELALWAIIPVVLGGVWLGVLAALNHNKPIDQIARLFSIVGWAFPSFVFGLLLLMIFYARLGWFPPGRLSDASSQVVFSSASTFNQYTNMMTVDAILNGRFDILMDALRHLVAPVITLAYISWALMVRVTRTSMLEALRQDYMTTARSKGLQERVITRRHALPNALIPVATIAGGTVVGLLNGVVITETIFNYPGIGQSAAEASLRLDVVTILGLTLFFGFILVVANLIVDISYVFIDPRVRLD
jgi:peptide/nickel transport system permease protein